MSRKITQLRGVELEYFIRHQHHKRQKDAQSVEYSFAICRRRESMRNAGIRMLEYDAVGTCEHCRTEIVYDRVTSSGKIHICVPCALKARKSGMRVLEPLDMEVGEDDVTDEAMKRELERVVSQNRHGETNYKMPDLPSLGAGRVAKTPGGAAKVNRTPTRKYGKVVYDL